MLYISNAFALSMLPAWRRQDTGGVIRVIPIEDPAAYVALRQQDGEDVVSCVGHADTAAIFSSILGFEVAVNRTSVQIDREVVLLVGQYVGPRLPEGTKVLPAGSKIDWLLIEVGDLDLITA